jgi:hypothetical protein
MCLLAVGIEHAHFMPAQCPHDTDPRHHRRSAPAIRPEDQRLYRGLPLGTVSVFLRERGRIGRGVAQRDQLAAVRQDDRIIEATFPVRPLNDGTRPCRIRF